MKTAIYTVTISQVKMLVDNKYFVQTDPKTVQKPRKPQITT